MSLRLIVPPGQTDGVTQSLADDARTTNVVVIRGCAVRPAGDLVLCEVTREATSDVLGWLKAQGLFDTGGVVVSAPEAVPSINARATELVAPGSPDDAIIWEAVLDRAYSEVRGSWSFYAFLTLATILASIAVITDSPILVVGAMVLGPEFAVVAALALGIVALRPRLIGQSLALLAKGFGLAIAITVILALLAGAAGWISLADVTDPRPLTGFIWRPDRWSAVVAVLAGSAGVLSQTAGRSNALVGVFISVTTIPAAGDLALSLALGSPTQALGSATQLGVNLLGMTVAGVITLLTQRALWRLAKRRSTSQT